MWNDTDVPLAYLITFRCHGSWLHGDKRGSVDRHHNRYKSPYIDPNDAWHNHNMKVLRGEPVVLDALQRQSVETAIRDTCSIRKWYLYAHTVRTNHIHVVTSTGRVKPERILSALKANATRQLREDGRWQKQNSPWVERGSKKYLWNEPSLARAIDYVLHGQGDELPDFDED